MSDSAMTESQSTPLPAVLTYVLAPFYPQAANGSPAWVNLIFGGVSVLWLPRNFGGCDLSPITFAGVPG